MTPFYTVTDGRVRLAVRLTPRARLNAVAGLVETAQGRFALAVRVSAPPIDGAANDALASFLAKEIGIPASSVRIVSGQSARIKILQLDGNGTAIAERIDQLLASVTPVARR